MIKERNIKVTHIGLLPLLVLIEGQGQLQDVLDLYQKTDRTKGISGLLCLTDGTGGRMEG